MHLHRLSRVAVAVFLVLANAGPASAEVDPAKLGAAKEAADKFMAMSKTTTANGQPPRLSDPNVKPLLDAVFDASDVAGGAPVSLQGLGPIGERMAIGVKVSLVYMLAGTGMTDLGQLADNNAAMEKVNANTITFAPEIGRFYDFQLTLQAAVIHAVQVRLSTATEQEKKNPSFQGGIADIRSGSLRVAAGAIQTIAADGITDQWRRDRMPTLLALGPKLATFLEPQDRTDLRDLALEAAGLMSDPVVKQGLTTFAESLGPR